MSALADGVAHTYSIRKQKVRHTGHSASGFGSCLGSGNGSQHQHQAAVQEIKISKELQKSAKNIVTEEMRLRLAFPLFLSSADHNYNAALCIVGPLAMFANEMCLSSMPPNAVRESNRETLHRLGGDLAQIDNQQLSAVDSYRMLGHDECDRPFWGYCVESARVDNTNEILILIWSDEEDNIARALRWMPLTDLYTRKQAQLFYQVQYKGPSEEVMHEILQVFRDLFEYAAETNWSYEKRLEFYCSFPFEELTTNEAVMAFRPILFGCPTFTASFEFSFPECE
mmetsp:Transcript_14017/g.20062  ORF Transcript_14017/g.20062 Transcript_14017/m.20062 type:complete len:283 (+) Transcript_14017:154-1002(+)|eukprot:CAMPEP_0172420454 /NCGR_PEP_ID=MMETSP1064-20121228/6812_1 /TAXON_ID=202472 /ORGANISM="Aulacoseira subarctica , Strain CCAP 1002/5" /LENGTH=282 /DNA_ID=CAMNT_0013160423 /DNA_START=153 /DNA_END=1001 /DNA_ORIENTATION=-